MKRLSADPQSRSYKSQMLLDIELLEKKRNHYFEIEDQFEKDGKDSEELNACIRI